MFKCFEEFEKQELELQTGEAISFNSLFAHRVHLFMDFQRGDSLKMAEQRLLNKGELDAPAILGARIASHFFIGEACGAIESFFHVSGISRSIFSLPGVLREMGKLQKNFTCFHSHPLLLQHKQSKCQTTNTSLYCCSWMNSRCSRCLCFKNFSALLGTQPVCDHLMGEYASSRCLPARPALRELQRFLAPPRCTQSTSC